MIEIPNYTVEKVLGRGGMAIVYLAVQDVLSRHVALKVMLPDMASDENFRKSFLSEGKIIANLEHPNIVRIHDVCDIDGSILYMTMEYLSGGTLKEKLNDRSLSYSESLRILEQISSGLAYAHDKGYIHRDVKPGNILFRENGTAVLTDFGIAKLQDTSSELTRMGYYTMGTAQYMSPEQAVATSDLDQCSDVYSLGLVFYEMLTGLKAFKAESTVQAIHQHTTAAPPLLPERYGFLQGAVNKVLAKKPADRYQTVDEFVEAIRSSANTGETVISRTQTSGGFKKSNKNRTGLIAGVIGGIVLLGALAFGATNYSKFIAGSNNADDIAEKEKLIIETKRKEKEQEIAEKIKRQEQEQQLAIKEQKEKAEDKKKEEKRIAEAKQKQEKQEAEDNKIEQEQQLAIKDRKKKAEDKKKEEKRIVEEKQKQEKKRKEKRLAKQKKLEKARKEKALLAKKKAELAKKKKYYEEAWKKKQKQKQQQQQRQQNIKRTAKNANHIQWITPTRASCRQRNGQVVSKGVCNAKWADAKDICAMNAGRLPTIYELNKAVTKCKAVSNGNKTKYSACYRKNGFVGSSSYWSSTTHKNFSASAWGMNFYSAVRGSGSKNHRVDVRCIKF